MHANRFRRQFLAAWLNLRCKTVLSQTNVEKSVFWLVGVNAEEYSLHYTIMPCAKEHDCLESNDMLDLPIERLSPIYQTFIIFRALNGAKSPLLLILQRRLPLALPSAQSEALAPG